MILDILTQIVSLLGVCIVFGVTVFVHELGHFLAARYKGLHVDRFAIGFGPKIFSFKRDGVEYAVCWIPFGGYVSLPQMAPMEMVEGKSDVEVKDLPPITPWAKIVTAFWGPAFSLFLALACACFLFVIGKNQNVTLETTTIGYVQEGSPAAEAGIRPGDRILRINGEKITHWSKNGSGGVLQAVILSSGETVDIVIERQGAELEFKLVPVANPELEGLRGVGFEGLENRQMPLIIEEILTRDSPAAKAGLEKGDRVISVDGHSMFSMAQIADQISHGGTTVELVVDRDGEMLTYVVKPRIEIGSGRKMIGVKWRSDFKKLVHVSPLTQVSESLVTMGRTLSALLNPQADVGVKHMSGPIGIFDVLRQLLVRDLRDLLAFCVFFNVNLAVLNLLPLPILDGGHIVFAAVEAIRKRPINVKVLYALQTSFFIILIAFMLFVSFHDVRRINQSNKETKELKEKVENQGEVRFSPEAETQP